MPSDHPPHTAAPLSRDDITGVILCGGQGSRMGGVDKGWVEWQGQAMVHHVLARLAPQVGPILISANRNIARYAALAPVVTDTLADFPGPLAGIVTALHATKTRYLLCVPCDVPTLPMDLAMRLADALHATQTDAPSPTSGAARSDDAKTAHTTTDGALTNPGPATLAVAATQEAGIQRVHPVCALMDRAILGSSEAWLRSGERRMMSWLAHHNGRTVNFADSAAFYNINTHDALHTPYRRPV